MSATAAVTSQLLGLLDGAAGVLCWCYAVSRREQRLLVLGYGTLLIVAGIIRYGGIGDWECEFGLAATGFGLVALTRRRNLAELSLASLKLTRSSRLAPVMDVYYLVFGAGVLLTGLFYVLTELLPYYFA
jgi:hypothetical protein